MTTTAQDTGSIRRGSAGGVAGSHPVLTTHAALVGPTTQVHSNRIITTPVPVACWRVDDVRFEYDSSFILPDSRDDIASLFELRERHKSETKSDDPAEPPIVIHPPLSIFGHADSSGNDDYNKNLSGRRATAVYGLLTRDAALWEELYSKPEGGDKWGVKAIQVMLNHLGFSDGGATGKMDAGTREDVKKFQKVKGLTADGEAGPKTREVLFLAYMDSLCGAERKLDRQDDFLARGADAKGKGDYQGCSEFNPALVFSRAEEEEFKASGNKGRRDAENAPNRRVMVLLFRPGSRVSVEKWPCPRAKEGAAACKKRFWSDGEARRRPAEARRAHEGTHDTFACRFYDRLTSNSPCEGTAPQTKTAPLAVRIFFHRVPIADLEVQFFTAGAGNQPGEAVGEALRTDEEGIARLGFLVPIGRYVCQIEGQPPAVVCTIDDHETPYILVLPVGRPYVDFEEELEFIPHDEESDSRQS